jgi:hypothetical protein
MAPLANTGRSCGLCTLSAASSFFQSSRTRPLLGAIRGVDSVSGVGNQAGGILQLRGYKFKLKTHKGTAKRWVNALSFYLIREDRSTRSMFASRSTLCRRAGFQIQSCGIWPIQTMAAGRAPFETEAEASKEKGEAKGGLHHECHSAKKAEEAHAVCLMRLYDTRLKIVITNLVK